jgi:3D (Asp-Asp-Asp) domain-containing protein
VRVANLKKILMAVVLPVFISAQASSAVAQTCSPAGYWTSTLTYGVAGDPTDGLLIGYFMVIAPDLTGTLKLTQCPQPHNINLTGSTPQFHLSMTYPDTSLGPPCNGGGAFDVTLNSTCNSMSSTWGPFLYIDGYHPANWTRNAITMERFTTTTARVSAVPPQGSLPSGPAPGSFSFSVSPLAGPNAPTASPASGMTTTSNPTTLNFVARGPMRTPTPGGLSQLIADYTLNYPWQNPGTLGTTVTKNDANKIAAFGLSCYMIALESDYGTPPNNCSATRINGVRYTGSVTNPNGLTGTYCSAFIANVRLQGTGQLNSGTYINYSPTTNNMTAVSTVTGADGTPVVPGQTVARDRAIIPGRGVQVDIEGVGAGLLANDTGGAILGYRLDLFNGAGIAACANYSNPIAISACNPEQTGTCPGSGLK